MGKYCQKCGAALEDAALFCCSCGAQQSNLNPSIEPAAPQDNTPQSSVEILPATTSKKRKKTLLLCGTVVIIAVALIILALAGTGSSGKAPFFGIAKGDSVEKVEKRMGTPDDFDDNGGRNFNYYYETEFLNLDGYTTFHFELDKVDTLSFDYYGGAAASGYDDVVEYYTKEYGEPSYASEERVCWRLDDNTILCVSYYPGGSYSKPHLNIYIYS